MACLNCCGCCPAGAWQYVANVVFDSVEEVSSLANVPKPCHAMARDPSAGYGTNTYSMILLTGSEGCVSEGHDKREYMRAGSPSE
jgi:hypothetical protein